MNVHPLLVHFPLAFFVTYSVFELLPFKKITQQPYWFYVKAILLILGVTGAFAAGIAGKLIENQFTDKALVELHANINITATIIFTIIAYAYIIRWIKKSISTNPHTFLGTILGLSVVVERIVFSKPLLYFFVLAGLLLIMTGGALGGIIVYGPDLDPFTHIIYTLFHQQLKLL